MKHILFSYITNKSNKIVEIYNEHIDESFHVKLDGNSVFTFLMFELLKMSNLCIDCAFCCVTALCFCMCL